MPPKPMPLPSARASGPIFRSSWRHQISASRALDLFRSPLRSLMRSVPSAAFMPKPPERE